DSQSHHQHVCDADWHPENLNQAVDESSLISSEHEQYRRQDEYRKAKRHRRPEEYSLEGDVEYPEAEENRPPRRVEKAVEHEEERGWAKSKQNLVAERPESQVRKNPNQEEVYGEEECEEVHVRHGERE